MLSIFDGLRAVTDASVAVRLLFAMAAGFAIGLERSYKNRPAGFRTHILVCIAGTMASTTGLYLYLNLALPTDITRVSASVISGLGFLCGGTILVAKSNVVRGLTTAAGLWTTGVIGIAIGGGFYEGALLAVIIVLITEIGFSELAGRIKHPPTFKVLMQYREKSVLDSVMRYSKDRKFAVTNLQVTTDSSLDETMYTALISLRGSSAGINVDAFVGRLSDIDGVVSMDKL